RLAAVFGRPQTSAHLDQPGNPDLFRRLHPDFAHELGREGAGEEDQVPTRPVSHVVDAAVQLTPALTLVPLDGQQAENLVAVAAGAGIAFAGAMASFGVVPNASAGFAARWADQLDQLVELAPIIVPGIGPIGGEEEVRDLQAYLRAVAAADGEIARLGSGPWDAWPG